MKYLSIYFCLMFAGYCQAAAIYSAKETWGDISIEGTISHGDYEKFLEALLDGGNRNSSTLR